MHTQCLLLWLAFNYLWCTVRLSTKAMSWSQSSGNIKQVRQHCAIESQWHHVQPQLTHSICRCLWLIMFVSKLVTECTGTCITKEIVVYRYSYSTKNLGNRYMHLTNYSINKQNEKYQSNTGNHECEGHKWYVDSFIVIHFLLVHWRSLCWYSGCQCSRLSVQLVCPYNRNFTCVLLCFNMVENWWICHCILSIYLISTQCHYCQLILYLNMGESQQNASVYGKGSWLYGRREVGVATAPTSP